MNNKIIHGIYKCYNRNDRLSELYGFIFETKGVFSLLHTSEKEEEIFLQGKGLI